MARTFISPSILFTLAYRQTRYLVADTKTPADVFNKCNYPSPALEPTSQPSAWRDVIDTARQINSALQTLPAALRTYCAADLRGLRLRQDREAMQDSDGGISIRGQVQVKPAGPCSEHVVASALSTLHISQIFYALPREFIFMVAVKAIFYLPVSANPFSCSLQGSTVNWLACWFPFLTQPLHLSKLGD